MFGVNIVLGFQIRRNLFVFLFSTSMRIFNLINVSYRFCTMTIFNFIFISVYNYLCTAEQILILELRVVFPLMGLFEYIRMIV